MTDYQRVKLWSNYKDVISTSFINEWDGKIWSTLSTQNNDGPQAGADDNNNLVRARFNNFVGTYDFDRIEGARVFLVYRTGDIIGGAVFYQYIILYDENNNSLGNIEVWYSNEEPEGADITRTSSNESMLFTNERATSRSINSYSVGFTPTDLNGSEYWKLDYIRLSYYYVPDFLLYSDIDRGSISNTNGNYTLTITRPASGNDYWNRFRMYKKNFGGTYSYTEVASGNTISYSNDQSGVYYFYCLVRNASNHWGTYDASYTQVVEKQVLRPLQGWYTTVDQNTRKITFHWSTSLQGQGLSPPTEITVGFTGSSSTYDGGYPSPTTWGTTDLVNVVWESSTLTNDRWWRVRSYYLLNQGSMNEVTDYSYHYILTPVGIPNNFDIVNDGLIDNVDKDGIITLRWDHEESGSRDVTYTIKRYKKTGASTYDFLYSWQEIYNGNAGEEVTTTDDLSSLTNGYYAYTITANNAHDGAGGDSGESTKMDIRLARGWQGTIAGKVNPLKVSGKSIYNITKISGISDNDQNDNGDISF